MRAAVIPIVTNALVTAPKGLEEKPKEMEIRGRFETIQTTASLKSVRILRRVVGI